MPVDMTTWAGLGAAGMAVGTAYPLYGMARNPEKYRFYGVLASITGIAFVAYVLMAFNIGTVTAAGYDLPLPRYIDWLLTTPLLVLYLGMLVRPGRRLVAALVAVNVPIIGFGIGASLTIGPISWAMFGLSSVAYITLLWMLLWELPARATIHDDRIEVVFGKLRNLTVVLWTLYPIVWLAAPTGAGLMLPAEEMVAFVYLDFISKVAFVVVAVNGAAALDALSTAEGPAVDPTPAD
ncbi:Bacteriorhodopsin [Halalkaliarchaeum sp. AArc-CO]|uniref:bacteriorhodopsin n=1 Tax=unclassified Halalkaliarchaeum TaxID=2678344 RepID=UPI00217F077B|nr:MULTISPECIES: bacteriorhodopsin [unclassified Halalkaliarchaeum]MDR5671593.1 bacteriorhodopsin [Halalkaliarchaeum sp. AArc-GB]UWG51095.1 Bacteriorhodopsin [Halalkaliarchaeum sp. AArc-CO]